ncbi:MAG: energy transducer TonB [Candidatus Marinimicrobia bacterium]|nr:energy transducer TonB [Candidatus Neomarinimicrobiota bacterium]
MNNYEKMKKRHPIRRDIILVIVLVLLILVAIIFPRFKDMREPVQETEIIYIAPEKKIPLIGENPAPAPDIVGSLLQEMNERPIPPELIEDAIDFEWPVLDTFSLDSLYKYEPKGKGPPPPSKGIGIICGNPIYQTPPRPIGGKNAINNNSKYPDSAKQAGIEGQVILQCFIDDKGAVQEINIIKGMDFPGMNDAAINAVKKTKFKPAVQRDRNVGVWIAIPVTFKLNTR